MSSWSVIHEDGSSEGGSFGESFCRGCLTPILIKYDQSGNPVEEELCPECKKAGI